jgi:GR25 family glycosyltransferase involved in LPS biosynthesis
MKIDEINKFCITLRRTKERAEYVKNLFIKQELDVRFFYGIDGEQLNIDDFNLYEVVNPNRKDWKIRNGVIGGHFSHMLLWNVIWRLDCEEALIFEDDVEFTDGWKDRFELCYNELPPDWDMFYLGGVYWEHVCGVKEPVSKNLNKYTPLGLHGYMVRKKILKTLIETTSTSFIDIDFGLIDYCKRNVYVAEPYLVTEKSYNAGNRTKEGIWKSLSNPYI